MINKMKNKFNLLDYHKTIGKRTNIHKVSYFFKEDIDNLHTKRLLIFDLEFSMNKHISEMGGLVIENNKVQQTFFTEYSIPAGEPYWCFDLQGYITTPLNPGKKKFSKKDGDWLLELIHSVDYVIVHNYVAEAQCLAKIQNIPYSASNCFLIQNKKFICTNYSFKNKYFKEMGITDTSNGPLSELFGWEIKSKKSKYIIKNKDIEFSVEKPKGVKSVLHNSFYDSVVTLTNFITLKKIYS